MLSKPIPIFETSAAGGKPLSSRLAALGYRIVPAAGLDELTHLAAAHRADGVLIELTALGARIGEGVGRVRAAPGSDDLCIVVYDDAPGAAGARVEALEAGADLVLHPSIDDAELAAQLQAQFGRTRAPRRSGAGAAPDLHDELRNAEAARSLAVDQLRAVFEQAAVGIWIADTEQRYHRCNSRFSALLGVAADAVLPWRDDAAATHPEDRAGDAAAVARLRAGAASVTHEKRYLIADGGAVWCEVTLSPLHRTAGTLAGFVGIVVDITERRGNLAQLQLLQTCVSRLNDLVVITEAEPTGLPGPRIVYVNDAFERRMGYRREEILGRTPRVLQGPRTQPETLRRIREHLQRWQPVRAELINYTKSGEEVWLELDIVPVADAQGWFTHWISIERDVTERVGLEDRLRQSQRLEAVGQLTGGVAHDFNNLLTVIMGNSDLLVEELADVDPPRCELAQMILIAAKRGEDLTQRLLAFARRQALDPRAVNLERLVTQMEPLLQRTLGEHIDIRFFNQPGLPPAMVDPGQIENALLNLCLNSRDAMPQGGQLTIETTSVHLDAKYAEQHPECGAGPYVVLAVSDTGSGIHPENLRRVFEPFFTTKGRGDGTGLGLAMVYGFIRQSEGHVTIYSEPGLGTTVRMYLRPARDDEVSGETPERRVPQTTVGNETILLVEDDDLVRLNAQRLLLANGYTVLEATNGPQALEMIGGREDIALLFTDVVMPGGMSGRELADRARQLRPRLRVLYTSGYTENAIVHHGRLDPGVHLLTKPYRRDELLRRVRALLDVPGPGGM